MNISGINSSSQNNASSKQPALDSHESSLRKQISDLQEELRTISNDQEMSDDQKTRKKQAAREQVQDLNSELRQYQIQKRQEEAAKKQEAAKQALKEANDKPAESEERKSVQATDSKAANRQSVNRQSADGKTASADDKAVDATGNNTNSENEEEQQPALLGSKESGVLITLSSSKEQIADMGRIRTSLESRQRTAPTEEEKASLQEKIARVSRGIGKKIIITEDTISSFQKSSKSEPGQGQESANALRQREKELKLYADEKLDAINRTGIINNKKMFDNISIIFN